MSKASRRTSTSRTRSSSRSADAAGEGKIETILGIDPGTLKTGWGVIRADGTRLRHVAHGTVRTSPSQSQDRRLQRIFTELVKVIREHEPAHVSLEKVFLARNVQSALKLGQVRGVALLAAAEHDVAVSEYNAVQVKKALTGYGHAAKGQMQQMVAAVLGLPDEPAEDAADALAAAICHGHLQGFHASVPGAAGGRGRSSRGLRWPADAVPGGKG
ncbi:MAG: crossover junction endodeoxyribonuclease RuvC [Deltaproteobacteria bacterium]|nr:crossover junction endodeoxyribonuclease RuvC [Deltaproteobacteria bacterium]